MNKKIILSAIIATSVLLTSCGRGEEPIKTTTNEGSPNTSAKPNEPTPKPTQPEEKPSEENLRRRTYANKWKVEPEVYLERIDIANLYNNPERITIDILKELATFETLDITTGKSFILKNEDLQHLKIRDLKYNGNSITFYTEYKDSKSLTKSNLSFNKLEFYRRKIKVDNDYVSTRYMRGVYEHFPLAVFTFDKSKYEIDYVRNGGSINNNNNTYQISFEVFDKRTKKTITINEEVSGFKPLRQIGDETTLSYRDDLKTDLKTKIDKYNKMKLANKPSLTEYLEWIFVNDNGWKKYLTLTLKDGNKLIWYDGQNILRGAAKHLDIYLESPRFITTSAELKEKDLHMKVQFQQANDVFIGKEYTLVIPNIK